MLYFAVLVFKLTVSTLGKLLRSRLEVFQKVLEPSEWFNPWCIPFYESFSRVVKYKYSQWYVEMMIWNLHLKSEIYIINL